MRKQLLFIVTLCLLSCSEDKTLQNISSIENPNFVLIFMDDLGYGDIMPFGSINYKTPHINKLAKEGMLFTNFYSVQAVCSASRAALLTGCYSNRIGISGALFPASTTGLNENEITIAELLKEKGLVIIDNVLWKGDVSKPEKKDRLTKIIREFNSFVKKNDRVEKTILPLGDGVTICRKL